MLMKLLMCFLSSFSESIHFIKIPNGRITYEIVFGGLNSYSLHTNISSLKKKYILLNHFPCSPGYEIHGKCEEGDDTEKVGPNIASLCVDPEY